MTEIPKSVPWFAEALKDAMSKSTTSKECIDEDKWTGESLSYYIKVSANTFSAWRNGTLPQGENYTKLLNALAPEGGAKANKVLRNKLEFAYKRSAADNKKLVEIEKEFERKIYSRLDLWNAINRLIEPEFSLLSRGSSESCILNGFKDDELRLRQSNQSFFIAPTDQLLEASMKGISRYEVNSEDDVFFDGTVDKDGPFETGVVSELIERHRIEVSNQVLRSLASPRDSKKPYNKKKFGVWSVTEFVPADRKETNACEISMYNTDFFTKSVMQRVFKQLQAEQPEAFENLGDYPVLTKGTDRFHMPHFAPSLGLNCFVISLAENHRPEIVLSKTKNSTSNVSQHDKYHVAMNEGIVQEDLELGSDAVDFTKLIQRGLSEEVGRIEFSGLEYYLTDVFLDVPSGETAILAVATVAESVAELNSIRNASARDKDRESQGSLVGVPCSRADIVEFVLDQPQSIRSFTSYFPGMLNSLMLRAAFSKLALKQRRP